MIKNARLSYARLFEAQQINGQGEAIYSVCLLIPKDSPEVPKIKAAIKQEFEGMKARYSKLNGKDPKVWTNPLRDGDAEKDSAEYQGCYFINAKRREKQGAPIVIDGKKQYITDPNDVYSGSWGNVAVSIYSYEFTGKYGVSVGLNGVQKTRDDERLDGGISVDDFDFEDENDDLFN